MDANEFLQQFVREPFELVVRIGWCWTKDSGSFPQMGDLYRARARFDQAIDLRSNQLVGKGCLNWLEWLTPKHRLGHPYGYAFKSGHLYRVLVREARPDEDDRDHSYYVERLLESDVDEPRLDPVRQFESDYRSEEVTRTLLVEEDAFGWGNVFGYRRATVRYLAVAQTTGDAPRACLGRLTWMEPAHGSGLKTRFGKLCACRVRVREHKEDPTRLLLVKVEKRLHDPRFEPFRQEYLKPVMARSPLGDFTLNRRYDWFEGTVDYLGQPCSVLLHVESGETDATVVLHRLEEVWANLAAIDRAARGHAAEELLENACDWCEEELSHAQFMERMGNPSVSVDPDGSVEFMFDDGGMFCGHVILVTMLPDGTFDRVDIMG